MVLVPIQETRTRDEMLDLQIMQALEGQAVVVGILAIMPVCPYMVHVKDVGIVWVGWASTICRLVLRSIKALTGM